LAVPPGTVVWLAVAPVELVARVRSKSLPEEDDDGLT
jgi:hypothetical protein